MEIKNPGGFNLEEQLLEKGLTLMNIEHFNIEHCMNIEQCFFVISFLARPLRVSIIDREAKWVAGLRESRQNSS